jgi:stage II sporulation protein GA (sporulation sigma-E factor processing peptidase)
MIVYFDVVVIVNLIMNFLILYFVAIILKLEKNYLRLLFGAAFGCIFLLSMFSEKLMALESLPVKFAISLIMIIISFKPKTFTSFIKTTVFFYIVSFMVGGGVFGFFYFFRQHETFYNDISLLNDISLPWWILLVSSVILFLFLKFFWPLIYKILSRDSLLVPLTICFNNNTKEIKAFIDTGNDLCDPISNYPVIIVELDAIEGIFGEKLKSCLKLKPEECLQKIGEVLPSSEWATRFRVIPFESIGKTRGLMIGFKPDMVKIVFDNKILETQNVIIGIYERALSPDGTYRALLNPDLLDE